MVSNTAAAVNTSAAPVRRVTHRPNALASVFSWELRRLSATRSTWIVLALAFVVSCLSELVLRAATQYPLAYSDGMTRTYWIDWGSNYGLVNTLPQSPGMLLGLYLPFLATDGVARDLKRRTHELMMTTPIGSWAYIWGRYLSTLLFALVLANVMLLALVGVAVLRHLLEPAIYVVPDLRGIIVLWALIVLPPTLLLSSASFALGTLMPQRSTLIKLAVMLAWFLGANLTARTVASCQQCALASGVAVRRAAWDPTSLALSFLQTPASFAQQLATQTQQLNNPAFLEYLHRLEAQLPDLHAWIVPHVVWGLAGIALVALATPFFRRFHGAVA